MGNCPGGELSLMGNCPGAKLVLVGIVLVEELSLMGNCWCGVFLVGIVLVGSCPNGSIRSKWGVGPSGELSWWGVVLVGNYPAGESS